jgi:hypothetical protein
LESLLGYAGKVLSKLTNLGVAKEHIKDAYDELGRVIEQVGRDRWNALIRERFNEHNAQELSLAQSIRILGCEWYNAFECNQENHMRIQSLETDRRAQDRALQAWGDRYRDDMERASEDYLRKTHGLSDKHRWEIEKMTATITELEQSSESQRLDFQARMAKMEQDHREKEALLNEQHNTLQNSLRKDIRSRNKALVARDNAMHLTDGQLKSQFSDLVREVDTLARLEWNRNRSDWTTEMQSQVSETPKRLQRQILQDTIWEILSKEIFSSPFRALGEEGRVLELQWTKDFGTGMHTPRLQVHNSDEH